jgi:hypothetical protein
LSAIPIVAGPTPAHPGLLTRAINASGAIDDLSIIVIGVENPSELELLEIADTHHSFALFPGSVQSRRQDRRKIAIMAITTKTRLT